MEGFVWSVGSEQLVNNTKKVLDHLFLLLRANLGSGNYFIQVYVYLCQFFLLVGSRGATPQLVVCGG